MKKELEYQVVQFNSGKCEHDDRFVPVITDFVTVASLGFTEVEDIRKDCGQLVNGISCMNMKWNIYVFFVQYDKVVALFGEDPKKFQPNDFFGIFTEFIEMFNNAYKDNEKRRKKKELEEKRRKIEQQVQQFVFVLLTLFFKPITF